ncbi:hypothetical protein ANAPC5_01392 [Anaplasma phagocytophilum]|nr:hypothetical protein ANAPC5_01392 [Anaplasma phagocytophilum]
MFQNIMNALRHGVRIIAKVRFLCFRIASSTINRLNLKIVNAILRGHFDLYQFYLGYFLRNYFVQEHFIRIPALTASLHKASATGVRHRQNCSSRLTISGSLL